MMSPLECRRQFILAPRRLQSHASWQTAPVGDQILHAHPELGLCQRSHGGFQLTLLGYVIDPEHPELTDQDILAHLLVELERGEDLFQHIDRYGGRWVLILRTSETILVVTDPGGLRQVFYTDASLPPWLASQPHVLAEQLDLPFDQKAAELVTTCQTVGHNQYWWPGERSAYSDVRKLLPNHYLRLPQRSVHRFWPRRPLVPLELEDGAKRAATLLRGLVEGATRRFPLAMPVTAGLDSRTLFAASRNVHQLVYYYTLLIYSLTADSADIAVPTRLLKGLGIAHHVLPCDRPMHGEFKQLYQRSVTTAHPEWGDIAHALEQSLPSGRVVVNGVASEIARCFYHSIDYPTTPIDGPTLAAFANMADNTVAIPEFARWLVEAEVVETDYGVRILDLFYWEQKIGSWAAMAQAEFDIVHESFTPFNCRALLMVLLSVDREYRRKPKYQLYRRIIRELWPQAMREPINPQPLRTRLRSSLRELLRKVHLHGVARRALAKVRS